MYDYYPTAPPYVTHLMRLAPGVKGRAFDMCCGFGHITETLKKQGRRFTQVIGTDIKDHEPGDAKFRFDALDDKFYDDKPDFDWAITCPPFSDGPEILMNAFDASTQGCAFILRLSFLEPCKNRYEWLNDHRDHLKHVIATTPRGRFRRDRNSGDSITVGWFVWDKNFRYSDHGIQSPFEFVLDKNIALHYKRMKALGEFGDQYFLKGS